MTAVFNIVGTGSRALSYLLGLLVFTTAGAVFMTAQPASDIFEWVRSVLGVSFIVLLLGLTYATLFCWLRLIKARDEAERTLWVEAGLSSASGIGTLALTYTLLGISLGIGSLADQELTPGTIQSVINQLTEHFSMAFLTTVVGLPLATILRAIISISAARSHAAARG